MFGLFKTGDTDVCENEFDIERMDVYAIDRERGGRTVFSYYKNHKDQQFYIYTTIEQHNQYVSRLRTKLKFNHLKSLEKHNGN